MRILWTIVIGIFAGAFARFLMPGRESASLFVAALLGVTGAVVADLAGRFSGWYEEGEEIELAASALGAIVVLFVYGLIRAKQPSA